MLGHLLRSGSAVQAHQWHIQRIDNRRGGRNIRPDQQRTRGLHRHLHEYRHARPHGRARAFGPVHGGFNLQGILAGLDQDHIHAASD